jgi:hypothetical protein
MTADAPPLASPLERLSLAFGGIALAAFCLNAFVPVLIGDEVQCFPLIHSTLSAGVILGAVAWVGGGVTGLWLLVQVARGKAQAGFNSLGALGFTALVLIILFMPPFADPVRRLFGMGSHGPICAPGGLLGNSPETWKSFARAMGYEPERELEKIR